MTNKNLLKIAFSVGDPAGIGPELCLKAAMSKTVRDMCRPLIIGDPEVLQTHARSCKLPWDVNIHDDITHVDWTSDKTSILARHQFTDEVLSIGKISPAHGRAILDSARAAINVAQIGHVDGVIACPHTQTSIAKAGIPFDGYPSFVAKTTETPPEDVFLMLCVGNVRIAHCTLHVSVREALDMISFERVKSCIHAAHETLRKIGISTPRILVAGINPHASEGGLFGREETDIIAPAIESAQSEGIYVEGPVGADNMLHRKDIDAFIVMFHDQGHIPAKLLARHSTAALVIGSPILFSSVAHGSALDIAGKGLANISAVLEALTTIIPAENKI